MLKTDKSGWSTYQAHMKSGRMDMWQHVHSGRTKVRPECVDLQEDYWYPRTPVNPENHDLKEKGF